MNDEQEKNLTLRQMLGSVLAAALGVQSGKNRARDFSHGKPSHFIILGVGFRTVRADRPGCGQARALSGGPVAAIGG